MGLIQTKKRTKKLTGLFAMGLAASFVLSACGSTGQSEAVSYSGSSATGSAATNAGGGTDRNVSTVEKVLNIRIDSEPSTLDPNNGLTDQYGVIYSLVYEPLCRLDESGEAKAALATDWTVSEDGLTYTFSGWDKEIVAVTGDATYVAQWKADAPEETDIPDEDVPLASLPQTGMVWWPVPMFLGLGMAFVLVGNRKKSRKSR